MPSKQLEILVSAKDAATPAFRSAGESAEKLGDKLGGLNQLAEAGHGMHRMMRTAHQVAIAMEVIPLGVDAAKAALAAIGGTAEESAKSQRALLGQLRSFPIVGKMVGDAAEWAGDRVARAFGRQTTAEMEAELAERTKALQDFAGAVPRIFSDLRKDQLANAVSGMMPGDAEIAKSAESLKQSLQKNFEDKGKGWSAAGQIDDAIEDKKRQIAELQQKASGMTVKNALLFNTPFAETESDSDADLKEAAKAQRELDGLIEQKKAIADSREASDKDVVAKTEAHNLLAAKAREKDYQNDRQYHANLRDLEFNESQKLASLSADAESKKLEGQNRGYEARLAASKAALAAELGTIQQSAEKQLAELGKLEGEMQLLADQGNKKAKERLKEIRAAEVGVNTNMGQQQSAATDRSAAEQANARDAMIRDARLASLREQGQAGDAAAKAKADMLASSREQEATEKALAAVGETDLITEIRKGKEHALSLGLVDAEVEKLKQRAALGDVIAGIRANALELDKADASEAARLNSIIKDQNASLAVQAEARSQLAEIGKNRELRNDKATEDVGLFILQQEAQLGDKLADKQVKKIELEKLYNGERQKALALARDVNATEAQRTAAKKELSALDAVEKRALSHLGGDKQPQLASLEESHYLTGVSAHAGQERDQFAPIVDAQSKTADITKSVADILQKIYDKVAGSNRPARELK